MTRRAKPARYRLAAHPAVPGDLVALAAYGPEAVAAARTALDDLAHGRVTGKALGDRRVSGDLTGLASVKFDAPGQPNPTVPAGLRRPRPRYPGRGGHRHPGRARHLPTRRRTDPAEPGNASLRGVLSGPRREHDNHDRLADRWCYGMVFRRVTRGPRSESVSPAVSRNLVRSKPARAVRSTVLAPHGHRRSAPPQRTAAGGRLPVRTGGNGRAGARAVPGDAQRASILRTGEPGRSRRPRRDTRHLAGPWPSRFPETVM